jgi:DNA (cytosine-5)-methyltransferase 1
MNDVRAEQGTALDFFAGIGLAHMGLSAAGWKVVFSNDISTKKHEMFRGHWGSDPHYRVEDIFDIDPAEVPSAELAWASFPCVDLSLAGNRTGLNGKHSGAFWGFHRILQAKISEDRPPLIVLENVPGMLTSHGGADLETLVSTLNDLGYVVDLLAIDAASFVPQSRLRLFIIGAKVPYEMRRCIPEVVEGARPRTVVEFIMRRPHLEWGSMPIGSPPPRTSSFSDVAEWFPPDADVWWPDEALERLLAQMSEKHGNLVASLIERRETSFATVYRRVRASGYMAEARFDGLAGCLRTPSGGSSKQFVLQMGNGQVAARNMTAVEYARLQGAPHFRIEVPFNQALFGFGDGVCAPVVEWVAREYLTQMRRSQRTLTHA